MADLFEDAARDWDQRENVRLLSEGIGAAVLEHVPLHASWQVMDFGAGTGLISSHVAPHVERLSDFPCKPTLAVGSP